MRYKTGVQLRAVQRGEAPTDFKPMSTVGKGTFEIRIRTDDAYRVFYVAKFEEAVYVLHAFQKKAQKTSKRDIKLGQQRYKEMLRHREEQRRNRVMAVTRGKDNVFEDLGFDAEEAANLKVRADLMLDLRKHIQERGWAQEEAAAFFDETQPRISNLINGNLGRFSIDKLVKMLARAGMEVEVGVRRKAA